MIRPGPLAYPDTPPTTAADLPASGEGSPARIGRRFAARLLDEIAITTPAFIAIIGPHILFTGADGADVPVAASIAVASIPVVYEFVMTTVAGATLGKMILGLRVVAFADGSHPRPYQMGLRVMVPAAPTLLSLAALPAALSGVLGTMEFVVYLTLIFSPVGRGLHDLAAGTIVLRTE